MVSPHFTFSDAESFEKLELTGGAGYDRRESGCIPVWRRLGAEKPVRVPRSIHLEGMIHGLRQQAVRQRTQKRNALRAYLSERLTSRLGKSALYALIESVIRPDEDGVLARSEIDGLFVSIDRNLAGGGGLRIGGGSCPKTGPRTR